MEHRYYKSNPIFQQMYRASGERTGRALSGTGVEVIDLGVGSGEQSVDCGGQRVTHSLQDQEHARVGKVFETPTFYSAYDVT
jgi:hypothetical protein